MLIVVIQYLGNSNFLNESFLTIFHHCVFAFRDPPKCQQDLELLSKPILQEKEDGLCFTSGKSEKDFI